MKTPRLVERFQRWRRGVQWSDDQRFLFLAVLIGIFAGLLIACFHASIELVRWYWLGIPVGGNVWRTIGAPLAGGLLSVGIVSFVFRQAQGSGVTQTKVAFYAADGDVPPRSLIGKFLACSLAIGSGHALGPEDPALHMGAGVASSLGKLFQLTRQHTRLIAPVGAAAGIAAAFNTPITAVLFVIEEVLASWNSAVLGSIVLSSVSAVVTSRYFLGDQPLFRVPAFSIQHPSELIVYAIMGLAGGLLAAAFVRAVARLKEYLHRFHSAKVALAKPLVAGLFVGAVGTFVPGVLGAGYETIDSALHNQYGWQLLLVLGLVKMAAALVCYSAGVPGGMFAPALFIGAMIGGSLGAGAQLVWPVATSPVGAYVLVGMGTFFVGTFRAPMTSIFMIFEISASYQIILPVMVANTIAYLTSRYLQPVPFFDQLARIEGLALPSHEGQREAQTVRIEDQMQPRIPPPIYLADSASHAYRILTRSNDKLGLVRNEVNQWMILRVAALQDAIHRGEGTLLVSQLVDPEPTPILYPDLAVHDALKMIKAFPFVPVVSRRDPTRLVGTFCVDDALRAYGIPVEDVMQTKAAGAAAAGIIATPPHSTD